MNRRKFLKATTVGGIGFQISKKLLGLERSHSLSDEKVLYLTDLDRCLPVSALSKRAKNGTWRMLDYETGTLSGTMLVALEESNAPDLTYQLNCTGWLSYRSLFLTQFMRELREELDTVARKKRSKRLSISAVVFRPEENLFHGMDLSSWIKQGLVDTIIPYSSSVRLNSYEPAWDNIKDVEYFVSLVQGTNCRLALNLMPRNLTIDQYYSKASRLYQSGVEYLFFWDGINRVKFFLRLGHTAEMSSRLTNGSLEIIPTKTRLKSLGGWNLNVETPG